MKALQCNHQRNQSEDGDRPQVFQGHRHIIALEHDAAHQSEEMGQRQYLSDRLRPVGHTAERKHETGEQDGRQKKEKAHLQCLHLIACQCREGDPHTEVGENEYREVPGNNNLDYDQSDSEYRAWVEAIYYW